MRLSFRWRLTVFYAASMAAMFFLLAVATHRHLDHELREEALERAHPGNPDWVLHADFLNTEINDILGELFEIWSVIALPMLALSVGVGMSLAGRSLRPVIRINRQLSGIGPSNLAERVEITDADPDLRRLAAQINGLLDRVEGGYERLASYSATVAHELRTPMMLMRLQIERAGRDIEPGLAEDLQEELARLGNYIERTLLSARAEQGKVQIQEEDFDLSAAVVELVEGHALLAGEDGRQVRLDMPSHLVIRTDPSVFRHIFDNLAANALRHGCGDVTLRARIRNDRVYLLILNKVGKSQAPANPGAGIGLRLVAALVKSLHGAEYRAHHGANWHAAVLSFPAAKGFSRPV